MSECISDSPWARNTNFDPNGTTPNSDIIGDGGKDSQGEKQTKDVLKTLLLHWHRATTIGLELGNDNVRDEWFHRLWEMHTAVTSHYHTPVHLLEMLSYLYIFLDSDTIKDDSSASCSSFLAEQDDDGDDEQAILLSIFFHDAIYDPRSATNEEDSAALFESFAQDAKMAASLQEKVSKFILATKAHKVSKDNPPALALFLDLDMAVLGKEEYAYLAYATLIRKEYSFVPDVMYRIKRAEILETFLENDAIYGTPLMYQALEERARSNVRKEIELLKQGTIPK